MVITI